MIRLIFNTAFILVLIVNTTGIRVHTYYCGNHVQRVSIFKHKNAGCEKRNCCHENTILYRNTTSYTFKHCNESISTTNAPILLSENERLVEKVIKQSFSSHPIIKPPPLPIQVKLAKMQAYLL